MFNIFIRLNTNTYPDSGANNGGFREYISQW